MNFRRWFIVLSALVLCVGLASAQGPNLTCSTGQGSVTPLVRAEGYTELVGDIVLTCTGGTSTPLNGSIPQVNIVIAMNAPVTSRLLPSSTVGTPVVGSLSEALLLIDDPVPGSQVLCSTPLTGCAVGSATGTNAYPSGAPNVFQGLVAGNQIAFNGVPVLPPGSTGQTTLRITNIRVSAAYLGAPAGFSFSQVQAAIATNPSQVLPISSGVTTVGFVNNSLKTTFAASTTSFTQCSTVTRAYAGLVNFSEQFPTAFKTRVVTGTTGGAPYGGSPAQNTPGTLYSSESGFVTAVQSGDIAGLADFGTRLKAVFTNIPSGVSAIYVSVNNVTGTTSTVSNVNTTTAPFAQLVTTETAVAGSTGAAPTASSTTTVSGISVAPITVTNGQAVATWEVMNANSSADETFTFAVYLSTTASQTTNTAAALGPVILGYAPSPNTAGFTATAAGQASSSLVIPRFVDGTASTFASFSLCQTVLLWPYVTTLTGFNTGFAISNTSKDPGSAIISNGASAQQSGNCALYIYGTPEFGTLPTTPITVPMASETTTTIAAGATYANDLASVFAATSGTTPFSLAKGYMFGVCNFQYAHGYAAISDSKAANWVTSYLALVVSNGNLSSVRGAAGENLNQ